MYDYLQRLIQYTILDLKDVMKYLPIGLCFFVVIGLVLFFISFFTKKVSLRNGCVSIALLVGYCIITIVITLLSREPGTRKSIDMILFSTIGNGVRNDAYVLENILLFIPFGVLLPYAAPRFRCWWLAALTGLEFSIVIELIQLITKRGYTQIDDIWTNTLGALIGYILFFIIKRISNRGIHDQ